MSTKTATNEKIYQDYRSVLRRLKKSENGAGRASARKQTALKQVADKYSVRISEVKQIVRELDEVNNITHEHPEPYTKELAFKKACEQLAIEYAENIADNFCPECKNEKVYKDKSGNRVMPGDKGNEVRVRNNPFEVEVQGILKPMVTCFMCYLDISYDV